MKILYVEDNPGDARLLQHEFAEKVPSVEIDWIGTYREAVERLSSCTPDKPFYDLLLADMNLPDGNGTRIISLVREKGLKLPVIIITGMGDKESAIKVLKDGASDYIVKHDDYLSRLPSLLETVLSRYRIGLARQSEMLNVLYCEYNIKDIELTQRHISTHAPHIVMNVVDSYQGVLEYFARKQEDTGNAVKPCDILLLNYRLAGMTTIDVVKQLREAHHTKIPIVILADEKNQDISLETLRLGADDVVIKNQGYLYQLPIILENVYNRVHLEHEREALKASENYFRLLIENASDLILVLDQDGRVRYCSPSIERIAGFRQDETLGNRFDDVVHPDDIPPLLSNFSQIIKTQGIASSPLVLRVAAKDGSWRFMEAIARSAVLSSGQKVVIVNSRDITARKEAEELLQESEAKYRVLVENSLVGVSIVQDDRFQFVNKKFSEIHGFTYEEIMAHQNIPDFIHPDDRDVMNENSRRVMESKENLECDFRIVRKDNRIVNVKGFLSLIVFKGRSAILGTLIDTTRERLLEGQLRQAHKMEAIGTLAGGIAHDFNNILTVLTGYGTLLKMELEKGLPASKSHVEAILSASQKATNLTQSLLAFSRQQPIMLLPVNVNETVKGMEKMLRRLLTEDIILRTNLSQDDLVVMADQTQLDQILINLVVNARDAMPKGGVVTVETRNIYLDNKASKMTGLPESGNYALLCVTDTGIGMDDKTKEHLFEPFFTTKEVGKGTGLGLSTVYGIVKQHSGYINVYSEKAMGTSFHIYLPITDAVERPEPADVLPKGGTETILLAEDNEEVRHFMATVLSRSGYSVLEAVDGSDATERFKTIKDISLLILDSVMPKKNGRQVYDEIAAEHPQIKVIFTSGYTRDVVLDKGIEDKRFDFIAKPVSPDALLGKVREVLDR